MTTLHGSSLSLRRLVEGCVPLEGMIASTSVDLTSWVRVEGKLVRTPTRSNMDQHSVTIDQFTTIMASIQETLINLRQEMVITIQSTRDTYSTFEPVLEISHGNNNLFLTGFTFDEIQTVEVEQFCRDHVHGSREFIATIDHDTPFGLGFVPIEANYRYMILLHKKRLRARLLHMSFDYPIRLYRMSLVDYFVRALETQMHLERITNGLSVDQETELQCLVRQFQLSDEALGTSTSVLVAPSPDYTSLMTLYFPNETNEYGTSIKIVDMIDGVIPRDEYSDEMLMLVPALGLLIVVALDDDVFEGVTSPVVVESEHVDPPLSFDEIQKQLNVGFLSVVEHPEWLANVILVPKKDGKMRVGINFQGLNKASLKDDFSLPHIDMLIDSTTGHSMLSFMDRFLGYNKILMALEDMEKTSFITEWCTYYYRVMPFELKNVEATY
ncbi:Transposon Ty3-G Gag-Pol polyprotein [Vitis vinifera]|uniref:Transposon Ty3-G Gag-Pol polyprotein n=1 Tax=Vitis vinifera TaxID=29760 RepID=A0A438G8P1_VITVI|nr:Transposon Ty3-G Gag-Pol polyprotein [Vitis vinifera]